ncbi:hypothetical protein D3Z51_11580 [Clostridiaceae bacterium]|nr:hypothetical protein [Clostridiaceae bacterium]RKI12842.1 hypothetical protein D7V81_11460 [bacterium 1XD21-70]
MVENGKFKRKVLKKYEDGIHAESTVLKVDVDSAYRYKTVVQAGLHKSLYQFSSTSAIIYFRNTYIQQ